MRSPRIHPLILGQLLLMGGCAQLAWEKPDAEPAAIKQDLEQCRQQAQASSLAPAAVASSKHEIHLLGLEIVVAWPPGQSERTQQERDLIDSCMQQKGYRLVPAKPGGMR